MGTSYQIGHPIKLRLNISSGKLEVFFPESYEFEYSLKISYLELFVGRFYMIVKDEDEYNKAIAWIRSNGYSIYRIGDMDTDGLNNYRINMNFTFSDLNAAYKKFNYELSKIDESEVSKVSTLESFKLLSNEIQTRLRKLRELLPNGVVGKCLQNKLRILDDTINEEYHVEQDEFLLKQPVKFEFDLENKMIEFYLPESRTLTFPCKVKYMLNDEKRVAFEQEIEIENAKFYNEVIKDLIEKDACVMSVGDLDLNNLYNYFNKIQFELNLVKLLYERAKNDALWNSSHYKNSKVSIPYETLAHRLSFYLGCLEDGLLTTLNCCFKNEETGEIVKQKETAMPVKKIEKFEMNEKEYIYEGFDEFGKPITH